MIEKWRHWSYQRHCLGKQGSDLSEVLQTVIGVYSAHPSGPLSLYARVKNFTEAAFYQLDAQQLAYRMPCMRLSAYMLPRETAHLIFAATIEPASTGVWEKRYSQKGREIPVEFYDGWKREILDLLSQPLTAKEIKAVCKVPDEKLKFVLNRMAFEGYLLRVGAKNLRSNIISYVAADAWGVKLGQVEMPEAQAWLAGAYLKAFGPARIKDFQWWAGIKVGEAKDAMASQETLDLGEGYLILKEDTAKFEAFKVSSNDNLDILPQWDCYTMGYAPDGRDRFIHSDMLERLYGKLGATGGNALGAVMLNGLVEGVWTSRFKGAKMEITLDLFEKPSASTDRKIEASFLEVGSLMKARQIEIIRK